MLGLGTRDEDTGGNDKVEAPEFLMTGDVLRGNTTGAMGEMLVVARELVFRQFALRVRVEIGTVATESMHQQDFGVQARGADAAVFQSHDGRTENVFQLHISRESPVAS